MPFYVISLSCIKAVGRTFMRIKNLLKSTLCLFQKTFDSVEHQVDWIHFRGEEIRADGEQLRPKSTLLALYQGYLSEL